MPGNNVSQNSSSLIILYRKIREGDDIEKIIEEIKELMGFMGWDIKPLYLEGIVYNGEEIYLYFRELPPRIPPGWKRVSRGPRLPDMPGFTRIDTTKWYDACIPDIWLALYYIREGEPFRFRVPSYVPLDEPEIKYEKGYYMYIVGYDETDGRREPVGIGARDPVLFLRKLKDLLEDSDKELTPEIVERVLRLIPWLPYLIEERKYRELAEGLAKLLGINTDIVCLEAIIGALEKKDDPVARVIVDWLRKGYQWFLL